MSAYQPVIIEEIVEQHFDEASFLWSQRAAAVKAPDYSLQDLAELDERVEAHIDGLRVSGEAGLEICEKGLDSDDAGTIFTAALLAFENGDGERCHKTIVAGSKSLANFRGLVSALGWMHEEPFNILLSSLIEANSRQYRRLAIAACGIRRVDPGPELDKAIQSPDQFLKLRALKVAGELKRQDLIPALREYFRHENHACRFASLHSALLMGDLSALSMLSQFVSAESEHRLAAMQIVLRVVDGPSARSLLKELAKIPEQLRDALIGAGFIGDPIYLPILIQQMERPELARTAGEAFSAITGVDLTVEGLEGEYPEGFEANPNDDPEDEDVEMDKDEDLPWPDVALIRQWWEQHQGNFVPGTRYLNGKPISPEQCSFVLRNGKQRQRYAAALELALTQPEAPFFNTKARGAWQQKRL